MCGIAGVFALTDRGAVSERELTGMRDRMIPRGPDDAGLYMNRRGELSVALAHRRLSILDLSAQGRQPMATADRRLWIVFNGEIFNYADLRRLLEQTGRYAFASRTDTEVILYGVREWGLEGCLERLRGMYAFALFDEADWSLALVRDPLGVKPLYLRQESHRLLFASEIKALLALPDVPRRLNEQALSHYLTFANIPAPATLFEGIAKLEPGCVLRIDARGDTRLTRYWDPARFVPNGKGLSEADSIDRLRDLLRQAVARRLVADVPVGVFLSGGLDSSLTVALMAERLDRPVDTFTVGIEGDPADESAAARRVAAHFGARHHEIRITEDDFLGFLPRMAHVQDEPLADPVCVPLYYVSQLARSAGTPVIQVGEGSDELFAGYPLYRLVRDWDRRGYRAFGSLPRGIRSLAASVGARWLSPEIGDALRRGASGHPLYVGTAIAFWDQEKPTFLKHPPDSGALSSAYVAEILDRIATDDPLRRFAEVELRNRLPELLLMRVDKMSMAASIETRVPFLDEDLVAFALTIPASLKMKSDEPKYLLKRAAEGIVPPEVIHRNKWGFCGSARTMLTERLTRYAHTMILGSPLIAERFHLRPVARLFDPSSPDRLKAFKIWNLLNLVLWHDCWFDRQTAKPLPRC